jgi:hypothetical protein
MSTSKGSIHEKSELFDLKTCKALQGDNPIEDDEFWKLIDSLDPVEVPHENQDFHPGKTDFGKHRIPREEVIISRVNFKKSAQQG